MSNEFESLPKKYRKYKNQPKIFNPFAKVAEDNKCYQFLERYVPPYRLPELLISKSNQKIENVADWEQIRKPEIMKIFQSEVYGKSPILTSPIKFTVCNQNSTALNGTATRIEVKIYIGENEIGPTINLLLYLPNSVKDKIPLFVGLNFFGNQTIHADPEITMNKNWVKNNAEMKIINHRCGEITRGVKSQRWQVEHVLSHGYGLATAYYGDIAPDYPNGRSHGIFTYFNEKTNKTPTPDEWGTISSWAWGLSRIMDYLEQNPKIDSSKIALLGHSRLGKTSLWAGAQDHRFALVISNCSGCTGAALSRRHFGETVKKINQQFPHWFCDNYKQYNEREYALPVDQHMLMALIAPRPLYVASAQQDLWADPKGEYLSAKYASPVYELYGKKGIEQNTPDIPAIENPIMNQIGHHMRKGTHDMTLYDWTQYIKFADKHFFQKSESNISP